MEEGFQLEIVDGTGRRLARAWLWLGVAALIGAGLLAILLVLSRTPGLDEVFPLRDFFRAALVVHVDLSVLIWFMLRALIVGWPVRPASGPGASLAFGILLAAVAGSYAWGAFLVSWHEVPAHGGGQAYFEALFWGGGHALQFQHALLAAVAWFWLASALGAPPRLSPLAAAWLFALAALPILAVPVIYALWPVDSAAHNIYFRRLMEFGHPLMLPLLIAVALTLPRLRSLRSPAGSALIASLLLFCVGGVLAYLIRGVNVVIPAHYHGSIVGITLAFMGLTYVLLPPLGFGSVDGPLARWQPYVYGTGQLLHVVGLAWSGGYGVQRKVAGAEQMLTTLPQKIGMGLMGAGGLVAVVGGIMFAVVCLRAMWPRRRLTDG